MLSSSLRRAQGSKEVGPQLTSLFEALTSDSPLSFESLIFPHFQQQRRASEKTVAAHEPLTVAL